MCLTIHERRIPVGESVFLHIKRPAGERKLDFSGQRSAITINENDDPSVPHDMLLTLEELLPQHRRGYRHSEGNSDSHCKSSLVDCSKQILIKGGALQLGTWQGIFFCEFDGPRSRKVIIQIRSE